jgi:hypothetical protein
MKKDNAIFVTVISDECTDRSETLDETIKEVFLNNIYAVPGWPGEHFKLSLFIEYSKE